MNKKRLSRIGIAISASVLFHASAIAACAGISVLMPRPRAIEEASRLILNATRTVRLSAAATMGTAGPASAKRSPPAPTAPTERHEAIAGAVPADHGSSSIVTEDTAAPIALESEADAYATAGPAESGDASEGEGLESGIGNVGSGAQGSGTFAAGASRGQDPVAVAGADFKRRFVAALVFPEAARRTGKTGTVGILASVAADGRVIAVRVSSSSGSAALDAAARNAALSISAVPVPGRPIDLSLRAVFARGTASLEP